MTDQPGIPVEAVTVALKEVDDGLETIKKLFTKEFNEVGARAFMTTHKWPPGLQDLFIRNLQIVPIRFIVCDDSGSMSANDSRKVVEQNGNK